MVPVNNLDETRVKPEQCLRTPLDETKMEHYHDQQMAVLSTLKPLASSNDHVGTREPPKNQLSLLLSIIFNPSFPGSRRKDHSNHVRRSIELLDPISLKNLQLEIFKQSHDAITEFKPIVQEGQQCLDLADVSDLGDEIMEFVQQLTVMNQPNRQPMLYELELLNRFIQQLQYEQLRRSSARMWCLWVSLASYFDLLSWRPSGTWPIISTREYYSRTSVPAWTRIRATGATHRLRNSVSRC